jgi:F-type H+-transporting ATPase subunit gamma
MSDTLAGLRHKLDGVKQLGAVVRAMKAVAATSIAQYEAAVEALGDYARSVELAVSLCLRAQVSVATSAPDRGVARKGPIGALIIGSDQGLVGRFNEVIAEFALRALGGQSGPTTLWIVGERVGEHLRQAGLEGHKEYPVPNSTAAITSLVSEVQVEIEQYAGDSRLAEVRVFHNRPLTTPCYEPTGQRLLPLDVAWGQRLGVIPWPNAQLAEVLGGARGSLPALVHEYLFIGLYKACAESLASENASRLEAMQRAEKNIESVSDNLRRSLNRLRQSSIDEELFDVVAGFNALSGPIVGH